MCLIPTSACKFWFSATTSLITEEMSIITRWVLVQWLIFVLFFMLSKGNMATGETHFHSAIILHFKGGMRPMHFTSWVGVEMQKWVLFLWWNSSLFFLHYLFIPANFQLYFECCCRNIFFLFPLLNKENMATGETRLYTAYLFHFKGGSKPNTLSLLGGCGSLCMACLV